MRSTEQEDEAAATVRAAVFKIAARGSKGSHRGRLCISCYSWWAMCWKYIPCSLGPLWRWLVTVEEAGPHRSHWPAVYRHVAAESGEEACLHPPRFWRERGKRKLLFFNDLVKFTPPSEESKARPGQGELSLGASPSLDHPSQDRLVGFFLERLLQQQA